MGASVWRVGQNIEEMYRCVDQGSNVQKWIRKIKAMFTTLKHTNIVPSCKE